jgi:hypothetical protein
MTTLPLAQHRLFLVPAQAAADSHADATADTLVTPDGHVRAMVLTLTDPDGLQRVWQGVQADLGLPAPGIAVNGHNGLQLWFSVDRPVAWAQAAAFLARLRQRYLPDGPPTGDGDFPPASGQPTSADQPALPPIETRADQWSAFVAPDLVRIFADEPWLSRPPGAQAQADLLARLDSMTVQMFVQALSKLRPTAPNPTNQALPPAIQPANPRPELPRNVSPSPLAEAAGQFLLTVMSDPAVDMALRIDAARALIGFDAR